MERGGWNRGDDRDHGGWNRGGHDGDDRRGGRGERSSVAGQSNDIGAVAQSNSAQDSATLLAGDYGIAVSSAAKIIQFAAGENMSQSLQDLNLSPEEASALANLNMPTDATVQKVASKLGEASSTMKKIFSDFVQDASSN